MDDSGVIAGRGSKLGRSWLEREGEGGAGVLSRAAGIPRRAAHIHTTEPAPGGTPPRLPGPPERGPSGAPQLVVCPFPGGLPRCRLAGRVGWPRRPQPAPGVHSRRGARTGWRTAPGRWVVSSSTTPRERTVRRRVVALPSLRDSLAPRAADDRSTDGDHVDRSRRSRRVDSLQAKEYSESNSMSRPPEVPPSRTSPATSMCLRQKRSAPALSPAARRDTSFW